MDGQMTIFDFIPPPEDDLETLDEEVMVARIAERTGLIFKKQPSDRWLEHPTYEAKYKKATIEVQYSRYDTLDDNNNKRFIGVGYSFAKGGGGSPCDTLTKAVDRIKRYQQTIDEANEKVYELDIRGICDDAYCPKCNYGFMDSETDAERCPKCGVKVSWERWHKINDEERKCCNNCNRYRMTVDATTCEPKYMICHRPGTVYGDQITNPESYVCEFWEEKGEKK
jgi:hypothetical protein